jgi:hypothetical protein
MAPLVCHSCAMDLTPFVDNLRQELAIAAEAGGDQARELAERLTAPLDAAVRLTLLSALSAAAEEITRELAPGSVDVRLRGRDAEFVVSQPPTPAADAAPPAEPVESVPIDDEGVTVRLNLRLPENLKARIEDAAISAGLSANNWLVRAATAALAGGGTRATAKETGWGGQRYTGWVR